MATPVCIPVTIASKNESLGNGSNPSSGSNPSGGNQIGGDGQTTTPIPPAVNPQATVEPEPITIVKAPASVKAKARRTKSPYPGRRSRDQRRRGNF